MSSTSPNSSKLDVNLFLTLPVSSAGPGPFEALKLEERGIHLIQLLLTCANHTSSGNLHHANACLCQILLLALVSCDPMQRLAAQFAYALASRLSKLWPGLYKALSHIQRFKSTKGDRASWTLVQAMPEERVIHIVDLGSGDPKLWVPFMQSFALMDHGPYLKITCVNNNKVVLENLGIRLVKEAESLDMPVQFNHVNVSLRDLATDMLKIRSGEALAMVSILSLHVLLAEDDYAHFGFGGSKGNGMKDCKQMAKFLAMVWSMSPKVFLSIEQEADHNLNRLVDRFVKGLHYYSAIFDSLDVNYGSVSSEERLAAEEMFGREIEHIVACVGMEREERHERYVRWMVRFGRARLKTVLLWNEAIDGYKIMNDKACMMICWHERPLFAVSAWTC
ncbi:hypothetical protein I3842_03G078800 [Carya illinoinensis]|uniref:Scarecrow-like protein 3 n=1 Tax=Carya illinoinensis TaxID=32201 RepID=A0A922FIG5_CARIL|nr:hypothetical protein I3842_03G078800 [Carya illinoinensis]